MDKKQFWELIDTARNRSDSWREMETPLAAALSTLTEDEMIHWNAIFQEYHYRAGKKEIVSVANYICDGVTDDGYTDFRSWLIAQGKEVYFATLANPDSLADRETIQTYINQNGRYEYWQTDELPKFETVAYIVSEAYEQSKDYDPSSSAFSDKMWTFQLSRKEKSDIAKEIQYSDTINVQPDRRMDGDKQYKKLEEMFPKLKQLMSEAEQRGYDFESIITDIIETGRNSTTDGIYWTDMEEQLGEFFTESTLQAYQDDIFDIFDNNEAVLDAVTTDNGLFYIVYNPDFCPNYQAEKDEIKGKTQQDKVESKPSIRSQLREVKKNNPQKMQEATDKAKNKNENER